MIGQLVDSALGEAEIRALSMALIALGAGAGVLAAFPSEAVKLAGRRIYRVRLEDKSPRKDTR